MKTILDLKGSKRFKQMPQYQSNNEGFSEDIFTMNVKENFDAAKAKEAFSKIT